MAVITRTPTMRRSRTTVIGAALLAALAINLALYGIGRAAGGHFTYQQSGKHMRVDVPSVLIMSLGPLLVGLLLVAWIGPKTTRAARIVVPILAVGTIALMTLPAHFDTTSTVFLSCMHLALIPIALFAIRSMSPAAD